MPEFTVVDPLSVGAQQALTKYFREAQEAMAPQTFDIEGSLATCGDYLPPTGVFLIAGPAESPIACGALLHVDDESIELKRMWVDPSQRGTGLAQRLLTRLEELAWESGARRVILDTNGNLTAAIRLYRGAGYRDIERYNDNPNAELWFEKTRPAGV